MKPAHSISSSVEVPVDPATAFRAFTEELNCWWLQGPINFHDSSRALENRMEPGVGGRIIEVYDADTGEGLELARITVWEPGERVGWQSSIDDVQTEVRFEVAGAGTRVTVTATLPENGTDQGGTSWVRMTPSWFGSWAEKRDRVPHQPLQLARLAMAVHYANPSAAGRWLRDVFGFTPSGNIPDDDPPAEQTWIEFHVGNSVLILFARTESTKASTAHAPWVFVDDLDAHYARATAGGAAIVDEIWQHGVRAYTAADLEGNHWTFAQASPRM